MKIRDILRLNIFKDSKILAGHSGLERDVEYVDVFEVPDIVDNWLVPKTFMLSTTFAIKELSEEFITHIFTEMIVHNVAGIALKLGRFMKKLPDSVIDIANSANFPIILLPIEFAYPCAIKEVLTQIIIDDTKKQLYQKKQEVLRLILSEEAYLNSAINKDILEIDDRYKVQICIAFSTILEQSSIEERIVQKFNSSGISYILYAHTQDTIIIMLYRTINQNNNCCNSTYQQIENLLINDVVITIGREYFLDNIKVSFHEAFKILKTVLALGYLHGTFPFRSVEIFMDIISTNKNKLLESSKSIVEPIMCYDAENHTDYFKTLEILLMCGFSKSKTIEIMHIHRNTLNYRINVIKKITNLTTLRECDMYFKLRVAMLVYKYYHNSH